MSEMIILVSATNSHVPMCELFFANVSFSLATEI